MTGPPRTSTVRDILDSGRASDEELAELLSSRGLWLELRRGAWVGDPTLANTVLASWVLDELDDRVRTARGFSLARRIKGLAIASRLMCIGSFRRPPLDDVMNALQLLSPHSDVPFEAEADLLRCADLDELRRLLGSAPAHLGAIALGDIIGQLIGGDEPIVRSEVRVLVTEHASAEPMLFTISEVNGAPGLWPDIVRAPFQHAAADFAGALASADFAVGSDHPDEGSRSWRWSVTRTSNLEPAFSLTGPSIGLGAAVALAAAARGVPAMPPGWCFTGRISPSGSTESLMGATRVGVTEPYAQKLRSVPNTTLFVPADDSDQLNGWPERRGLGITVHGVEHHHDVLGRPELGSEPASDTVGDPPYPGLLPYRQGDEAWFFGRERDLMSLLTLMERDPLVCLVGASGSGKTSLVHAGLLPRLRARIDSAEPTVITPGTEPNARLDDALRGSKASSVLVIDQFEELFTLTPDPATRIAFARRLVEAVDRGEVRVLLVTRADFMGSIAELPGVGQLAGRHQLLLGPMSRADLRNVVLGPGRRAGRYPDPGLVDRVVDDTFDADVSLSLLSTALQQTWITSDRSGLRLQAYELIGGVGGAVRQLADTAYEAVSPDHRWAVEDLFERFIAEDGPKPTRRPVPLAELRGDPVRAAVLDVLVAHRLVVVDEHEASVVHEVLFTAWPLLNQWISQNRDDRARRLELLERARAWAAGGRGTHLLDRGDRLVEATGWRARQAVGQVDPLLAAFIDAGAVEHAAELEREVAHTRQLKRRLLIAVLLLAAAIVASFLAVRSAGRAESSARRATTERARADVQAAAEARSAAVAAPGPTGLLGAVAELDAGSPDAADTLAAAVFAHPPALSRYLADSPGPIDDLAVEPVTGVIVGGGAAGAVTVWDGESGAIVDPIDAGAAIVGLDFTPDGQLVTLTGDGRVLVRRQPVPLAGEATLASTIRRPVDLAVDTTGRFAAAVGSEQVKAVDLADGEEIWVVEVPCRIDGLCSAAGDGPHDEGNWTTAAWSPTGLLALGGQYEADGSIHGVLAIVEASGTDPHVVTSWELPEPDGTPWNSSGATAVAFVDGGESVTVGTVAGQLVSYSVSEPTAAPAVAVVFASGVSAIATTRTDDGRTVSMIGSAGGDLLVEWSDARGRPIGREDLSDVFDDGVSSIAPAGTALDAFLVTTTAGTLTEWRPFAPGTATPMSFAADLAAIQPSGRVVDVARSPSGSQAAVIANGGVVLVDPISAAPTGTSWPVDPAVLPGISGDRTGELTAGAFLDDTHLALLVAGLPVILDTATGAVDAGPADAQPNVTLTSIAVTRDGALVAGGRAGDVVRYVPTGDGSWQMTPLARSADLVAISAIAASPRADVVVVTFAGDGGVVVLDSTTGAELARLAVPVGQFAPAAFSADGRFVAVGGGSSSVTLLETDGWTRVATLSAPARAGRLRDVQAVGFSSDGEYVMASGPSGFQLWRRSTGEAVAPPIRDGVAQVRSSSSVRESFGLAELTPGTVVVADGRALASVIRFDSVALRSRACSLADANPTEDQLTTWFVAPPTTPMCPAAHR